MRRKRSKRRIKERKRIKSHRKDYRDTHKKEFMKYVDFDNSELREMVMHQLGSRCAVCGITDRRVLQIDHVYGGGSEERRNIGPRGIYIKILESNGYGYQILCANCNTIKRYEEGENL